MTAEQQERPDTSTAHEATDQLKDELQDLLGAVADRALASARDTIRDATERLTQYAEQGGGPGLVAALTGAKSMGEGKSPLRALFSAGLAGATQTLGRGGGRGGAGKQLKVTNIVESIDVPLSVRVAYNLWTQFEDFPSYMKKVENVEQEEDQKLAWNAQIFLSHRSWESTILQQIPDQHIVWRSTGDKGHVDGAVSFHEFGPQLTRILLVLEYYPQGLFEQTGNLWRAQGRRVRLELKHYRRHVMTHVLLNPGEVTGWRGVIKDGEVVQDHDSRVREEEAERDEYRDPDREDYGDAAGYGDGEQDQYEDEDAYADEDDDGYADEDEDGYPEAGTDAEHGDDEEDDAGTGGGRADEEPVYARQGRR